MQHAQGHPPPLTRKPCLLTGPDVSVSSVESRGPGTGRLMVDPGLPEDRLIQGREAAPSQIKTCIGRNGDETTSTGYNHMSVAGNVKRDARLRSTYTPMLVSHIYPRPLDPDPESKIPYARKWIRVLAL